MVLDWDVLGASLEWRGKTISQSNVDYHDGSSKRGYERLE
jgi:hypothetical protein